MTTDQEAFRQFMAVATRHKPPNESLDHYVARQLVGVVPAENSTFASVTLGATLNDIAPAWIFAAPCEHCSRPHVELYQAPTLPAYLVAYGALIDQDGHRLVEGRAWRASEAPAVFLAGCDHMIYLAQRIAEPPHIARRQL